MFYVPYSSFTLDEVTNSMSGGIDQLEQQLHKSLVQLQQNPNPSQADLLIFQANLQTWTGIVQMNSSITKIYGDTMKQVVTNMGS